MNDLDLDLGFRSPSETEADEESANDIKLNPPNRPEVESESEDQYRNPKPEPAAIPEIHLARGAAMDGAIRRSWGGGGFREGR